MEFKTAKLSNGLKVIMNRNTKQTTVTIAILINVGSNWETPDINGIAHFLEHMFFKGTKNRPNQRELALELNHYGAESNAFTTREMTCYHIKVNSDHLLEIIDILGDVMTNSLYRQKDIDMEKSVVNNELKQRMSNPDYMISTKFSQDFFDGLPIAKPVAGSASNISQIKRDHLMAFLRKFYRPENIVISIAGNFESYPSLKQHLEKGFSSAFHRHFKGSNEKTFTQTVANLEKYQTEWINVMNLVPYSFKQTKINHHISRNDIEHTFVVIGFQGFKYLDDQKYKSQFLSMILGGGMASRLFENVRSKHGLVYSISSSHIAYDYTGVFAINYSCNHSRKIQMSVLDLIKEEIEKMKNQHITEKEYQTVLDNLQNKSKMNLENTYETCLHYGVQYLKKTPKIKNYQQLVNQYKKISIEDLHQHANMIFDWSKCMISTLSPNKIEDKFYEKLVK
jgi:predicted Zn-dependent peptidase